MKNILLLILFFQCLGCSSVQHDEEHPWVFGKKVIIKQCEEWKEKDPEADC